MAVRRLLDDDWDNNWDDDDFNDDFHDRVEDAAKISVGIIIAIVVGIILFVIISVIVCIYCVCKKRTVSSGAVVQRGPPSTQVTTYSFSPGVPQQPGMVPQPVPPHGYGYPPPAPMAPGPVQHYPPMAAGGWTQPPPPYTPQSGPIGFNEKQMASAPPME